jgi:5-methylcytosine-specific restriction endonuclease McrA
MADKSRVKETYTMEQREKIKLRDHFTCQLCDHKNRSLRVHHIDPYGSAADENLITLCASCHDLVHNLLRDKGYKYIPPRFR